MTLKLPFIMFSNKESFLFYQSFWSRYKALSICARSLQLNPMQNFLLSFPICCLRQGTDSEVSNHLSCFSVKANVYFISQFGFVWDSVYTTDFIPKKLYKIMKKRNELMFHQSVLTHLFKKLNKAWNVVHE